MSALPPSFDGNALRLELLDTGASLVRLCWRTDSDWEPPAPEHRNERVDAPDSHRGLYAVLYTAASVMAAAVEARIIAWNGATDTWNVSVPRSLQYGVVRYGCSAPGIFVPLDVNRTLLGLSALRLLNRREPYRAMGLELYQRFGRLCHGLSWESFHREQLGRVYAIWHERKDSMGLQVLGGRPKSVDEYPRLARDEEWNRLLDDNPAVRFHDVGDRDAARPKV